jgi:hypothetical protein
MEVYGRGGSGLVQALGSTAAAGGATAGVEKVGMLPRTGPQEVISTAILVASFLVLWAVIYAGWTKLANRKA